MAEPRLNPDPQASPPSCPPLWLNTLRSVLACLVAIAGLIAIPVVSTRAWYAFDELHKAAEDIRRITAPPAADQPSQLESALLDVSKDFQPGGNLHQTFMQLAWQTSADGPLAGALEQVRGTFAPEAPLARAMDRIDSQLAEGDLQQTLAALRTSLDELRAPGGLLQQWVDEDGEARKALQQSVERLAASLDALQQATGALVQIEPALADLRATLASLRSFTQPLGPDDSNAMLGSLRLAAESLPALTDRVNDLLEQTTVFLEGAKRSAFLTGGFSDDRGSTRLPLDP